jgi:Tfp pilus assembly protein PilF
LRRARGQTAVLLIGSLVPTALIIAFLYHRGTFFAIRYILFALPALLLLVTFGALELSRTIYASASRFTHHASLITPAVVTGACLLLLGLTWHQADVYLATATHENWRAAGRLLSENVRPGDIVVAPQPTENVFFYALALPGQIRPSNEPNDLPQQLAPNERLWLVLSKYIYPPDAYHAWTEARPTVEYRVDDALQVFLVAPAATKADLLRATQSIRPPETWSAWATLAAQNETAGNVDTSIEQYQHAIALANSADRTISLTLDLGDVLRRARRYDQAEAEYRQVVERAPSAVDGWIGLGRVDLERSRFDDARLALMRALSIDAQSYATNLFLADLYRQTGEPEKASEYYAVASQIVPELVTPP